MLKLGFEPEKVFEFSKSSLFPALLTGIFFVYFYSASEFSENAYSAIHFLFIIITTTVLLISACFKVLSVTAFVSIIYICHILMNACRYAYGEDYVFSASYNIWSILFIPNLLIVCLFFKKQERCKYWSWLYLFLFIQTAFIERVLNQSINADSYYFYKHIGMLNYPAISLSVICMLIMFVAYINKGKMLDVAAFFSMVSVFSGMLMSDNLYAFSLFLFLAVLIELVSLLCYLHYKRFKDEELNISGLGGYCHDAEKKYPLKYSISLLYLDDYDRLSKRFGKNRMVLLKKMFLNRIKKVNTNVRIYNYSDDALILVFMNASALECFEQAEEIRRALVKSIFVFNENNHLQLTVSQCISEKKRSDANALAVLDRAEESLQKACKFTRNITIKA